MSLKPRKRRVIGAVTAATLALTGFGAAQSALASNDVIAPGVELFVNPNSTTLQAAAELSGQARADAQLLGSFASASWFTKGTPAEVEAEVDELVSAAASAGSVPVLVAYNLPFRDCAQYSAGGAANTAEYNAWIDGFVAGIGDREAVVILEPDGLGIIPWYTTLDGNQEWCQPAELDPATATSNRFEQLNHAVDQLAALDNTAFYLDGTHSGWLGVGEVSDRLIKAGVAEADGFFLNASNYVETERLQKYGSWVSDCIYLSENSWWEPAWCGSQYYPANPNDFSTWGLTDAAYDQAFADTGLARDALAQKHFVIDTSRNGVGPWTAPEGAYPDPEVWCNPLDRGLGLAPTTDTGSELIDAYLWIKVPGESDGQCFRGTGGPEDPARGMVDPAAGQWFVEQARELIEFANPGVAAQGCDVNYSAKKNGKGSKVTVTIRNTSDAAVSGWTLAFALPGAETLKKTWKGDFDQSGATVTVDNLKYNAVVKPGKKVDVGFTTSTRVTGEPLLFTLNGLPCTSR